MKKLLVALAIAAALGGCATNQSNSAGQTQQIEMACAGATTAVSALTVALDNNKLTIDQATQVQKALVLVEPICMSPTPPTMDTIKMQAFTSAVAYLEVQAAGVK